MSDLSFICSTTIGIGFSSKSVSLNRAPGWEPESWGFHGDDGHIFASQNVGKHYGEPFSSGDTIGCGVNFRTGSAFFTKNGKFLGTFLGLSCSVLPDCNMLTCHCDLGPAFKEVKGKLYPSVGMKRSGEHVRVNFGQTPFIFDIDTLMKACCIPHSFDSTSFFHIVFHHELPVDVQRFRRPRMAATPGTTTSQRPSVV